MIRPTPRYRSRWRRSRDSSVHISTIKARRLNEKPNESRASACRGIGLAAEAKARSERSTLSHSAFDEHLQIFDLAGVEPKSVLSALIDFYGTVRRVLLSLHSGVTNR